MTFKSKIAKIFTAISLVVSLLLLASCFGSSGALTRTSFTVDRSSIKTDYLIGEEIDFSGIKATAKYSDAALNNIRTKDLGEVGDMITSLVGELKGFNAETEERIYF